MTHEGSRVTRCVYSDFLMNSDEFKLIFGSETESEEEYTFNGFSEQELIMGDSSSSSKKHSKTKRMPTTTPYVRESVEATPQDEHCVRPCKNRPKSKQKSLEDTLLTLAMTHDATLLTLAMMQGKLR